MIMYNNICTPSSIGFEFSNPPSRYCTAVYIQYACVYTLASA